MSRLYTSDLECPLFCFTYKCLFSSLFIKTHQGTESHVYVHDLAKEKLISEYLGGIKKEKRIIDYLVGLNVVKDIFFVFNIDDCDIPSPYKSAVITDKNIENSKDISKFVLKEVKSTNSLGDFQKYLQRLKRGKYDKIAAIRRPSVLMISKTSAEEYDKIAAIHYISRVDIEEFELSISFVFLKNSPYYPEIVTEILESREILKSFLLKSSLELEARAFFRTSLRSAVAAIMARNMSHNIGSHVLNYLSNPDYFVNLEDFWL